MTTDNPPLQIDYPAELPIISHRDEIIAAICANQVVIIAGDTGSGKSTQLPKMCLDAGRGRDKRIGCTQPRRIAATSVSARVSDELGPGAKGLVGYKIRFQDKTSKSTRVKFMTDGILLAETRKDPRLNGYDTIIVDEAHERSLNIDFLLGILRRLLQQRKDLKVIITSATIDTEKFSRAFDNAPVIEVSGRGYPVEVRYVEPETVEADEAGYIDHTVAAVLDIVKHEKPGDMLVFMPTERDIREVVDILGHEIGHGKMKTPATVLPLFGRLSGRDQNRIFRPVPGRKIVVATNVAETSLTVPGIRYVVDTGLARMAMYNVRARTNKLPVAPISRASADQRKGRCGRVGPGICVRLYAEADYLNREEFSLPEILRSNLAEVILRMVFLNLGDPKDFPFVDPPAPRIINDGFNQLFELGAISRDPKKPDRVRLTAVGRTMARLPLDPSVSRMIIEARNWNCLSEVCVIAAALSIADPRVRPADKENEADAVHAKFVNPASDFLSYLKIWKECNKQKSRSQLGKFCKKYYLSFQRIREWRDIHEQITMIMKDEKGFHFNTDKPSYEALHRSILAGNLRNIALKKSKNIYQGASGKEVMIFPGSSLFNKGGKWVMAAELVETSRLFARCVADIKPEWLPELAGDLLRYSYAEPHWEKKRGQVVAYRNLTLFGLLVESRKKVNYGPVDHEESRRIFIQSALVEGDLTGSYKFLEHNRKLIAGLEEMEDRIRQRDILVDDFTLYNFYHSRLPSIVRDQASLNRQLKKNRGDKFLWMQEDDVIHKQPEKQEFDEFPEQLEVDGCTFDLSYKFEPGTEEDGVSVIIPVHLAPHLRPAVFEWLVPGLLKEKIVYLLKGLPKTLRKQLIPIPRTAEKIFSDLKNDGKSLYLDLQKIIYDSYGLRIGKKDWPVDTMPDHLKVRYCLVDEKGRPIKQTRDFREIRTLEQTKPVISENRLARLKDQYEKEDISPRDLCDLPERIPITTDKGELSGYAFPALVEEEGCKVSIRLVTDHRQRENLTATGLLALYGNFFNRFKGIHKDCALSHKQWALYEGLATQKDFNARLYDFIVAEIFEIRKAQVPDLQFFEQKVKAVKEKGIYARAAELRDLVISVLQERRATADVISRFEKMAGGQKNVAERYLAYRTHLHQLMPRDFLQRYTAKDLKNITRYLKALQIRVERAYADPNRDAVRAAQLKKHEQRLEAIRQKDIYAADCEQVLADYREMVEEYRISLFAQELKTAYPVSEKRLEKKWREVEAVC